MLLPLLQNLNQGGTADSTRPICVSVDEDPAFERVAWMLPRRSSRVQ